MGGHVTLQTIADRVGVSRATVSNAFSRPDQLSEELRKRILDIAHELGYPGPDPAARRLRRGRAGAIGLLLTETLQYAFDDPYAIGFLQGLASAAEAAGIGLLILPMPPDADAQLEAVKDAVVDGFCVFSLPRGHPALRVLEDRKLPLVFVDQPYVRGIPFVGIDERAAGRAMAEHVLGLGHHRVAMLTTRLNHDDYDGWADPVRQEEATYEDFRQRLAGFREAAECIGLTWADVPVYEIRQNTPRGSREAARQLLTLEPRPTAVMALSDVAALAVMDMATEMGLGIPDDLSVTGFSGVPMAESAGLTTIEQPMTEIGRAAGEIVLGRRPVNEPLILPHRLAIRSSSGPPAEDGRFADER